MNAEDVRFLSVANVIRIHDYTLRKQGGAPGIREWGLLESAVEMPRATFGGQYLHQPLADMAAAYLFHLCQNHAFVDGNKRVGALAALTFLTANGVTEAALPPETDMETMTMKVANGQANKTEVADWFRSLGIS